jgi:hypothetical protein
MMSCFAFSDNNSLTATDSYFDRPRIVKKPTTTLTADANINNAVASFLSRNIEATLHGNEAKPAIFGPRIHPAFLKQVPHPYALQNRWNA